MKQHPDSLSENVLETEPIAHESILGLIKCIKSDYAMMQSWLDRQAFYRWKRYGAGDPGRRGVTSPWVGASDIVMPLGDAYCNQIVAPLMTALFGGSKHCRMVPMNPQAWDTRASAEMLMEAWARGWGTFGQKDLKRQLNYALSSLAQTGRGVLIAEYEYRTRVELQKIRRESLPGILGKLVVIPKITAVQREQLMQAIPDMNSPDILAFFGSEAPVQPLDSELFKHYEDRIKSAVIRLYRLDYEEKIDRVACNEIMSYLRNGTSEKTLEVVTRSVIEDGPRLRNVEIQDLILPPRAPIDLSRCDRVVVRTHVPKGELEEMARDMEWSNAEHAAEQGGRDALITDSMYQERLARTLAASSGLDVDDSDTVELWRVWSREEIHRTGGSVREMVYRVVEPNSGAVLYKAEAQSVPLTVMTMEANADDYFDSRGVGEILKDPDAHVTALYRGLENTVTLTTYPTFQAKRKVFTDPDFEDIAPGDVIPVDAAGDIVQFPMASNTMPLERMLHSLLMWPERLIGGLDNQMTSDENFDRPRTATEIGKIDSSRKRLLGMRAMVVLDDYAQALQQVWRLILRHGPEELYLSLAGERPERLTMAQIRGEFALRPAVSAGDLDPASRYQRLMGRLQVMMQWKPILDLDITRVPNYTRAFLDVMEEDDPVAARALLPPRPSEQIQGIMQSRQAEAERLQQIKALAEKLDANVPTNPEELLAFYKAVREMLPHKNFQRLNEAADQARHQTEVDAGALANQGGP